MKGKPRVQRLITRQFWVGMLWLVLLTGGIYYASAVAQAQQDAAGASALLNGTIADNFDNGAGGSTGFTGSDGTLPWLGDWQNPGQIFVQSFSHWCKSGYCLRMYGNKTTAQSARQANLSGASSATLTFDYAVYEGSNGSARVEFSGDGVNYQLLGLLPTQYPATTKSYAIPATYLTASFRVRFVATNSNALTDLYVDNVVIQVLGGATTPTSTQTALPPTATSTVLPATATRTATPTATKPAPTATPTPITPAPTATSTMTKPAPTATATATKPTPTTSAPTATPTVTPTMTKPAPTATSTVTPTNAPTPTITPTSTPLGTPPVIYTLAVRIGQGLDDVEESVTTGAIDATSSDLELVNDSGTSAGIQKIGLRFTNLQIPKGAYISAAYLEFEVDETQSEATALTIRAQDSDSAPAFSSTAYNVSNRPLTAAAVSWNVPAWDVLNIKQQTPDLTPVLQAIVNRAGWSSGNSMAFVINGSGHRTAKSYDLAAATASLLHVEYSTTPIVVHDLVVENLEVTQAIQDLNQSVRLVKDKRTFVRFYGHTDQGKAQVSAQLEVKQGTQSVVLLPVNGDAANAIGLSSTSSRAVLAGSFLFELPASFKENTVTLTGRLNPQGTVSENNLNNNSSTVTVNFEPVQPIRLMLYSIGYGANYYPSELDLSMLESWLRRAYPISQLQVTRRTLYYGNSLPTCETLNNLLATERTRDLTAGMPKEARYYGMVVDKGGFMRGCGWQYFNSGPTGVGNYSWDTDGTYGDWYGGHELGHGYLRNHANFCGATGGPAYPYPNGRISPVLTGAAAIYGFDADTQAIYGPDWTDIMTYCDREWMSDFTYEALMTTIQNLPVTAAEADEARLRNQTDRLLIVGTVAITTGQTTLNPIFILPNAGEVVENIPGDYAIVLKDGNNVEVARYPFTPHTFDYGPPLPTLDNSGDNMVDNQATLAADTENLLGIHELVPYVDGVTTVEIWGPTNVLLGSVVAQAGKPIVTITAPVAGQIVISDTLDVAWAAADPDGEALFFNVQYSVDQGQSWESVALNLTEPHLTVALRNLRRGQDLRFRVWATDGIHTSYAEMPVGVILPSGAVTAKISAPESNATLTRGQPVVFQGSGYDVDTGYLTGEALIWLSDRDGQVGSGETLSTTALSLGTHTIELRAQGKQGSVASDFVQVNVVEATPDSQPLRLYLPLVSK